MKYRLRSIFFILITFWWQACGDTDKLTERTLPSEGGESGQGKKVGNRDSNAQTNSGTSDTPLPGEHSLFFTVLRSDLETLPKQFQLTRGEEAYLLQKTLSKEEPQWQKACPDECELGVASPDNGQVAVASVNNIGFSSYLIAYSSGRSAASQALEGFAPEVVIEVVCRDCASVSVTGAAKSACANLRSMWANGDSCVQVDE